MKMFNGMKTIIIFGAGFALGLTAGSFIFQGEIAPPPVQDFEKSVQPKEEISVSLMLDFSDGKIITCNNQKLKEKRTVLDLLEICSSDTENPFALDYDLHPEFGSFIKQIGDKENGKDNKYWQYWVNNEYAQVGASQFQLEDGDIVEWKFFQSQFE